MKKINLEGLEGKALETATQYNSIIDKVVGLEQKSEIIASLENEIKSLKAANESNE